MDIKIITMHAMHNPGSVYQAFALQKYLSSICETKIIDYRPQYYYSESSGLKFLIKKTLFFHKWKKRDCKFSSFISQNMILTKRYSNYSQLLATGMSGDIFIVGSDQLWNMDYECGHDAAFYLGFVHSGKKITYATSVGKKNISRSEIQIYRNRLKDFDYLSVREKSTAEIFSRELYRNVEWVCDPVMLLKPSDYKQFIRKAPLREDYVMVYLCEASTNLDLLVEKYRKIGYKIILIGGFTKRCKCDVHVIDAGPEDFLTYIYHAKIVISSSFHATAFCHIFHKEFWTILPKGNGERILSLLTLSGLKERAIMRDENCKFFEKVINWFDVDKKVKVLVDNSKAYLNKAIEV